MADAPPGETLSPAQLQTLLEGVDEAFRDALHGRYGGGIEAVMLGKNGQSAETLRLPNAGASDRILLVLQESGQADLPSAGGGTVVGSVSLADGAVRDVSITAEIFDARDVNEASDASTLLSGLVFSPEAAGLSVVRSAEAARQGSGQETRRQRGWLPSQSRTNPSRAIGLGCNGHRRAGAVTVPVPATSDLLVRLGAAAARVTTGRLTLVVQTSQAGTG